ncbi:MAG: hypothetical protein IKV17_00440 [Bacteroidaceae bacterium]|nr:hypothetical protein [Bacteroidaceae bacterium]
MKNLKLMTILLGLILSMGLISCSNDNEPDVSGYNDFFVKTEVLSAGGLDAAAQNELQAELNSDAPYIYKVKKEEAVEIFEDFVEEYKYDFIDGLSGVKGTLKLKFILLTTKGVTVKSSVVCITQETAWIEKQ